MKSHQLSGLDCDGTVISGALLALSTRLDEMCAWAEAAVDGSDPKGVHKMRVASRRLRSALRDFAPYLGKRRVSSGQKQLKEVARSLGRVRDDDVAIMTLEETAAEAPADVANGIRRLAHLRDVDRQAARERLLPLISSESLADLKHKFKKMMDVASDSNGGRATAAKRKTEIVSTYRQVGSAIILARLDELEKLSNNLYQPLKVKPLHEMRIGVKHLRYALQLFEQCWGTSVSIFAGKLATLQTSLGELHDCDVWLQDLGKLANQGEAGVDFDQRRTVVWLLCHFMKLRGKQLNAALMQWQEWEAEGFGPDLRIRVAMTASASQG
jgi:CHAD domain-containing protein